MTKTIQIEVPEGYNEKLSKTENGLTIEFVKIDKEKEMKEFLKPFLTELVIVTDERYPDSLFYKKSGKIIFELEIDPKNSDIRCFWVNYSKIWKVFETKFGLSYYETQCFIKTLVENTLKLQGLTPRQCRGDFNRVVENTLKLRGLTPSKDFIISKIWWKTL